MTPLTILTCLLAGAVVGSLGLGLTGLAALPHRPRSRPPL